MQSACDAHMLERVFFAAGKEEGRAARHGQRTKRGKQSSMMARGVNREARQRHRQESVRDTAQLWMVHYAKKRRRRDREVDRTPAVSLLLCLLTAGPTRDESSLSTVPSPCSARRSVLCISPATNFCGRQGGGGGMNERISAQGPRRAPGPLPTLSGFHLLHYFHPSYP